MSSFNSIKQQVESDKKVKFSRLMSFIKGCSITMVFVLNSLSRSYSIVMLQLLINVVKRPGRNRLNFTFLSDSTCSLRFLKEIQLKNFIVLSEIFLEGKVRVSWIPSIFPSCRFIFQGPQEPNLSGELNMVPLRCQIQRR